MSTQKILIIGQGGIGLPVTNRLAEDGLSVTGLARRQRTHYDLDDNVAFMQADALTLTADQLRGFTQIAIIITPDEYSASGYQNSYLAIGEHLASLADHLKDLSRLVFISSTGVYGQDNGDWIDESTAEAIPSREASKVILQAEQALRQDFGDKLVIIRPSGIYGRNRLMRLRKAREPQKKPVAAEHWSNRIMDRDLVNIIVNVLTIEVAKPLYIATDYSPVTTLELGAWLSEQVGAEAPVVDDKKRSVTGKRLHSNIPLAWLDYPDWQAGYRDILRHLE
ncbi:NAD-dependent epimerase/dehydratase family protein [Psychrobacter sp.]|uniref:NAD-dependent epimerase/dehydratase family protein n=1 Tax=Psychrobacter sp. TaxID=56811 RepID=UPI002647EBD5|nr:NAD-dependent epimerase/dehydratase family protein [Psychrobacter sp.]MDN6275254.1 NAD-dependent epimerase/dehydratase family protein [Psychrobacter sp.]MDN6308103.1 NAD-dependent epimerase/dehydratase family protein [Psychrobacter sp.]